MRQQGRVKKGSEVLHGIDVSNNNGKIGVSGKDFVIAKATEGTGFRDSLFTFFWDAARTLGILRGAYLFMDSGTDPKAQAEFFVNTVKAAGLMPSDILVLDAEETGLTSAGITACVNEIGHLSGKNTYIYTNYSMINAGKFAGLYNHPLWIANPGGTVGNPPSVHPWPVWTMQQYSWNVVDANVFNGGKAEWEKLANVKPPAPPAVLAAPAHLVAVQSPVTTFKWGPVTGAKNYQIQVKDKAGDVVHDAMIAGVVRVEVTLNPGTHYTWRVKSSPDGTWSAFEEYLTNG
jgi:lysozyme